MNQHLGTVDFRLSTLSPSQRANIEDIRYQNAAKLRFEKIGAIPGGIRDACKQIKTQGLLDDLSHEDRRSVVERLVDETTLKRINDDPLFAIRKSKGDEFTDQLVEDMKEPVIGLTSEHGESEIRASKLKFFLRQHLYQKEPDSFFQVLRLKRDMDQVIEGVRETFSDEEKADYEQALSSSGFEAPEATP